MDSQVAAAFHEAGHAVAITLAFRDAPWLPHPAPPQPVRYIEITDDGGGNCVGMGIYSTRWALDCIAPRYRPLMERQVTIHLAGGVSEAVFRGERRKSEVLAFAMRHCDMDGDLKRASNVLAELRRLTGYPFEPRDFVGATLEMMLEHWPAVEALAEALVDHGRIEGWQVERIVAEAIEDLMAR